MDTPLLLDFFGAHSSGKTVVMNLIEQILTDLGYTVGHIPSVSRTHLSRYNLNIYDKVDDFHQMTISAANWGNILESLGKYDVIMTTDLVVRGLGYGMASPNVSKLTTDAHKQFLDFFQSKAFGRIAKVLWFYIPIEFPMVADEVRKDDEEYRRAVDEQFKYIMRTTNLQYAALSGSIHDRAKQVMKRLILEGGLND